MTPEGPVTGRIAAALAVGLSSVRLPTCGTDEVDDMLLMTDDADGVDAACSSIGGADGRRRPSEGTGNLVCWHNNISIEL